MKSSNGTRQVSARRLLQREERRLPTTKSTEHFPESASDIVIHRHGEAAKQLSQDGPSSPTPRCCTANLQSWPSEAVSELPDIDVLLRCRKFFLQNRPLACPIVANAKATSFHDIPYFRSLLINDTMIPRSVIITPPVGRRPTTDVTNWTEHLASTLEDTNCYNVS